MNYLHTSKGHGIAGSEWLASGGDHISTDGGGHLCIDESPSSGDHLSMPSLLKGPRPRLPTGGDNEAIKAKEPEVRWQVALTVLPAEATTFAVGSVTSGSDLLSTDDSGHLRTSVVPTNARPPQRARAKRSSLPSSLRE